MDCADVLSFIVTGSKARGQPARNDGATDIEVGLPFLVRRLVAGERVSCVKRFVFEQQLSVSVKRPCASAVYHLGRRLPTAVLTKPVGTILRGESIVVDPNVLGLGLRVLPFRRAISRVARRLLFSGGFVINSPGGKLFRP